MAEKSIYDQYIELYNQFEPDPDKDQATNNLPILFATEYLTTKLRIEADRIIAALGSSTKGEK